MALRQSISATAARQLAALAPAGRRGSKWIPYMLVAPALVVCIGILYPFGLSIYYSLTNYSLTFPVLKFTGLHNYRYILSSSDFWHATFVTFAYAIWAVGSELVLGVALALLLNRETRVARMLRGVVALPLMVAPVLATLMWKLMMNPSFGVANWFLSPFGLRNFAWGDSEKTALFTSVLIDVWIYTPFVALLVLAGLRSLNPSFFEAAELDGAGAWAKFRAIILPAIAPYLIVCALFRLVDSLRAFDVIFALTKGGPGNTLWNYQVSAYYQTITFSNVGLGAAYMLINWILVYAISQLLVSWWNASRKASA